MAGCGALLYLITAITNPGIIAIDDYGDVISKIIPAQAHSVQEIVARTGFRSPFTNLVHLAIVKTAYALGVTHPLTQFRIDLAVIGLFSFGVILWAGVTMFAAYAGPERDRHRVVFAGLLGFYFLAPLVLTRPMIESMSAPFLAAAAALACRYRQTGKRWPLVLSIMTLTIGAMHRPQVGACALALVALVIWLRRWKDLAVLAAVGAVCTVASGMLDYRLIGEFHGTLRRYVAINEQYSHDWERSPWYIFPLLFLGLSIPPTFFLRYRGFDWKTRYGPLYATVLFFAVFLAAHMAISHKEERFMIPATPLFLVLLTPLLTYLIEQRQAHRWRVWYFAVVNSVLLLLVVTSAPQRAGLQVARYLDEHPEIGMVTRVGDFLLVPTAFISHPLTIRASKTLDADALECGGIVVTLALSNAGREVAADPRLEPLGLFQPGPLERLIVAINPKHNARRGPVLMLAPRGCGMASAEPQLRKEEWKPRKEERQQREEGPRLRHVGWAMTSPEYKGPRKPVRPTSPCRVTKVTDGDSIVCAEAGRVRLLGIDAPELSQKPFGNQSRGALTAMIPPGSRVALEQDVQARDRNDRLLAYVWRDGRLVNWEMVRAGWVVTLTYSPNVQYVDQLRKAVKEAEKEELGLWAVNGFSCLPFDHRHGQC